MKKKQINKVNKTEVITKEKEQNWYISPCEGIPTYNPDSDPHCPNAQLRKYNEQKRLKAKLLAKDDKITEKYIKSSLQPNIEDISNTINNNYRNKNSSYNTYSIKKNNKESHIEIEILQKIVVRENLLSELHKLINAQNDISSCFNEVVELVKAIRYQTIDIIEGINVWQQIQSSIKPFQYKGLNYLIKIKGDLDFLDNYEEIIEKFCFEFKSNPLAYRGGGNIISGYDFNKKKYKEGLLHSYYSSKDDEYLDGLEVSRLHNAEKVIQNEFNHISSKEATTTMNQMELSNIQSSGDQKDVLDREIFKAMGKSFSLSNSNMDDTNDNRIDNRLIVNEQQLCTKHSISVGSGAAAGKTLRSSRSKSSSVVIFNPRKVKQERIIALNEEASELKAMMTHVEEKVGYLNDHHEELVKKNNYLEAKMKEARSCGKEVSAQHIAAEISVNAAFIIENNTKIKDLQREVYFISLERKRKHGTANKLKEELIETKRRSIIQKQIETKIKKEGLLAALSSIGSTNKTTTSSNTNSNKNIVSNSIDINNKNHKNHEVIHNDNNRRMYDEADIIDTSNDALNKDTQIDLSSSIECLDLNSSSQDIFNYDDNSDDDDVGDDKNDNNYIINSSNDNNYNYIIDDNNNNLIDNINDDNNNYIINNDDFNNYIIDNDNNNNLIDKINDDNKNYTINNDDNNKYIIDNDDNNDNNLIDNINDDNNNYIINNDNNNKYLIDNDDNEGYRYQRSNALTITNNSSTNYDEQLLSPSGYSLNDGGSSNENSPLAFSYPSIDHYNYYTVTTAADNLEEQDEEIDELNQHNTTNDMYNNINNNMSNTNNDDVFNNNNRISNENDMYISDDEGQEVGRSSHHIIISHKTE